MEVSGAPLYTCCSAAHPANSISQSKAMISRGVGNSTVSRFWDNSHMRYYCPTTLRCGGKKQKPKNKNKSKLFSELGFGFHPACGLVEQVKAANMISEAEEALLVQLEQLRAQEKELKMMRKQVKAKLSSTRLKNSGGVDCEAGSSSSSSESSESSSDSEDCLEVVDTNRLRMEATQSHAASQPLLLPLPISAPQPISPNDQIAQKIEEKHYCTNGAASTSVSSLTKKRIEVCIGNKCKKSGAEALLQEFNTRVGVEGTVVGCKCMGKCRDGPNVKVFDGSSSVPMAGNNPLCIGVNLEDVGAILSNLVGEDQKVGGLVTA